MSKNNIHGLHILRKDFRKRKFNVQHFLSYAPAMYNACYEARIDVQSTGPDEQGIAPI